MVLGKWMDKITGRGDAAVTMPPMDGALRPNQRLEELPAVQASAPDNLVLWEGRVVYSSGSELCDLAAGKVVRKFDRPVACLAAVPDGRLAVGLSGAGLQVIGPDGSVTRLGEKQLVNVTAVTFTETGIAACEGSARRPPEAWKRDLMETGYDGKGTGTLWLFDKAGRGKKVASGLRYPNGVMSDPAQGLVVSESWSHRLLAIDPASGRRKVLLADLPGYPGRLSPATGGGAWLAVFAPRSQLIEFVLREKDYRTRMMAEIEPDYWVAPALANLRSFLEPLQGGAVKQMGVLKPWAPTRSYGLVVRLDADWQPVLSLHSRADGTRHGVTSVLETGGELVIASKGGNAILHVPCAELVET